MNDQNHTFLAAQKLRALPAAMDGEPDTQELLDRIAEQARKIETLERILSHPSEEGEPCRVVTIGPGVARNAKPATARQCHVQPQPWWPAPRWPGHALEPLAGRAPGIAADGAKVIAFAVFGLEAEALQREVRRIAVQQAKLRDFVPLFLTDAKDHEVFRRHRYGFEYFPALAGGKGGIDVAGLQPRLEFIEAKWGIDLFINLGHPRGELIRREVRPARDRYMLAKAHFLDGRYLKARKLMDGFTAALAREARIRVVGTPPRHPKASIVVISHRDHPGVEAGLASIARQIGKEAYEVILVDNGHGRLLQHGKKLFGRFTLAEPGFNCGCSAARNLGAHVARAPRLIFLDDDGITTTGAIAALMRCMDETGAVAVRGRVEPLTSPEFKGNHYDLGPSRIPALNTTEGISIWAREPFIAAGGFDPLLAGHEGVELCSRLWRFYGPAGFVYEPDAVLLHDYAPSNAASAAKTERYRANIGYLDSLDCGYKAINAGHQRFLADPVLGYQALLKPAKVMNAPHRPVSILTTARNGGAFLAEYTRALKQQTDGGFEVIFIDDHSTDGTAECIAALWSGDSRLKVIANTGRGRGAALNTALQNATGDICLIADVDDLSIPQRVALTRNVFAAKPGLECMSFIAYNESNPFRLGGLRTMFVRDLSVRQLFGMPVSFPAFAFLRKNFSHGFDETLEGGIDCDWLFRRSAATPLAGEVVFYPAVYYREHEGQITASRKTVQLEVRRRAMHQAYAKIAGEIGEREAEYITILADTRQATASLKAGIARWVASLLSANRRSRAYDPELLDHAMAEALRDIRVIAG